MGVRNVSDLKVPMALGPWSNGMHPGLVVGRPGGPDDPCIVVPLTSSKPRVDAYTVRLKDRIGTLDPVLYICCQYPTTILGSVLTKAKFRATLDRDTMKRVQMRLGPVLGLRPT